MTETIVRDVAQERAPAALARAYLQAWNDHDGPAVRRLFAPDGSYRDPTLPGPVSGEGISGHLAGLVAAFPDLAFAVEEIGVDGERVTVQWRMRGTNTGPLPGAPAPTGGTCDLPGAFVITAGPAGIGAVAGYFDRRTLLEQLGQQCVVVPADDRPMHFGMSVRTALGRTAVPGALTMTWIEADDEQEQAEVVRHSGQIVEALAGEPGFLGMVGTFSGLRGHTLAAWSSPEAAAAVLARTRPHRDAVDRVRNDGFGRRAFTSFWVPHRMNDQVDTCASCGSRVVIATGAESVACACGTATGVSSYL